MKGVIFDLDDTLIYSATAHMLSIKDVLNEYKLPMKWIEIRRRFGKRFIQIVREVYGINDMDILREMELKKRKYFEKYLKLVMPLPGANVILSGMKTLGLKSALATMSSKYEVDLILEKFHWKEYFDAVVTGENMPSRPDPTILKVALRRLKATPLDAVSIGDSIYGIEAAHSIGLKFIGVPTGAFDKVDLKRAGADYVVNDLFGAFELITWLKAQGNILP